MTTAHPLARPDEADKPGLSAAGFAEAFANYVVGPALVTLSSAAGPVAALSSTIMRVSATPALFAIAVAHTSAERDAVAHADSLVLHFLAGEQVGLAESGATGLPIEWGRLYTGEPYFVGATTWIRGRVVDRVETGDSTLVIAHATHACYPPVTR
jgi:flavin reductase (DIM6/NTAB) family NADH-FMN oxidoreductase RutF